MRAKRDASVVRLKVTNESSYVNVPWAPQKDTAWGLDIGDDDVTVTLYPGSRGANLGKKLPSVVALSNGAFGPWVLRRDVATEMFDGVEGVSLRRAGVVWEDGPMVADLVYVDVTLDLPLDRDRAQATYTDAKRPWSSAVRDVEEVHVVGMRDDALVMARLAEMPSVIVASAKLVQRFTKLKAPVAVVKPPQGHMVGQPVFAFWAGDPEPFPKGDDARAVAAFRRLLDGDAAARREAVAHPWLAYAVARIVDRRAQGDTRGSALRHPVPATLYARFVDGAANDDTRAVAARWAPTAIFYMRYVDRALTPSIREALRGPLQPSDIDELESELGHGRT